MKEDITMYSENELSLLVFNDETLYRQRKSKTFISDLRDIFEFTGEQLLVLRQDLKDDEDEQ